MTGDCEVGFTCGRFGISVEPGELAEVRGVESVPDFHKQYNVAPSQSLLAARMNDTGKREVLVRFARNRPRRCIAWPDLLHVQ